MAEAFPVGWQKVYLSHTQSLNFNLHTHTLWKKECTDYRVQKTQKTLALHFWLKPEINEVSLS